MSAVQRWASIERVWRAHTVARAAVLAAAAVTLAACGNAELYSKLSERQANEMVALLANAGMPASKATKDGVVWSVSATGENFGKAIELLSAHGYPRDEFESLGRVFKREGFVSSQLEERARLIYGLSQELSSTVASIDGVLVARVHLAVPERDPLVDKQRPSSAAVFIKHRPGVDMSAQVGQIKALVVNSIDGLPYDNVTVALFPAQAWPLTAPAASAPASSSAVWIGSAIAAVLAAGAGAVYAWRHRGRWRRPAKTGAGVEARATPLPIRKVG